jgi:hypothetical protein
MQTNRRVNFNTNTMYTFSDQTQAEQCLRARAFIVGSIDSSGVLSFSPRPVVHSSETGAAAEADRLSKINPNKTFVWVQLRGGRKLVNNPHQVVF